LALVVVDEPALTGVTSERAVVLATKMFLPLHQQGNLQARRQVNVMPCVPKDLAKRKESESS
jgi:hypothetical protein